MGIIGVNTRVADAVGDGDDAAFNGGHRCGGLYGRAGGIKTLSCAVVQGVALVGKDLGIVGIEGFQIVGGVGSKGQHIACAHFHHRNACAAGNAVLRGHFGNGIGKGLFRSFLQGKIQRQAHRVAGFGVYGVKLAGGFAFIVGGDDAHTVLAVEIFFKSGFHTRFAHNVIVGVGGVFLVGFPLGVAHAACVAQHMGCISGGIFAGGRGFHRGAGKLAVFQLGDQSNGNVFGKEIRGVTCKRAVFQLIAGGHDAAGLLIGPGGIDLVEFAEEFKKLIGGDVGERIFLRQDFFGKSMAHKELLQSIALAGSERFACVVNEGAVCRDGQVIRPGKAVIGAKLHQPPDLAIEILLLAQKGGVEMQRIGGAVGYHHLAVSVGNDTAGGFYLFGDGDGTHRLLQVLFAVNDLGII